MRLLKEGGSTGLSQEEYQARLAAAIEEYGEDSGLSFDPESGQFAPGNVMLQAAKVLGQFRPQSKEEADAYNNLGVKGALEMRDMQRGITSGRNQFAEEYMVPVVDAIANATSVGKAGQIGMKGYKLLKAAGPQVRKMLAKQLAKKSGQLAGKKKMQGTMNT